MHFLKARPRILDLLPLSLQRKLKVNLLNIDDYGSNSVVFEVNEILQTSN